MSLQSPSARCAEPCATAVAAAADALGSPVSMRQSLDEMFSSVMISLLAVAEQQERSKAAVLNLVRNLDAKKNDVSASRQFQDDWGRSQLTAVQSVAKTDTIETEWMIPAEATAGPVHSPRTKANILPTPESSLEQTDMPEEVLDDKCKFIGLDTIEEFMDAPADVASVPTALVEREPEQELEQAPKEGASEPQEETPKRKSRRKSSVFNIHLQHKALKKARKNLSVEKQATSMLGKVRHELSQSEQNMWLYAKKICKSIIRNPAFDWTIGFVILINSIFIGIEAQWSITPGLEGKWPADIDLVFMFIYLVEILIRVIANGWSNFHHAIFIADFAIVIVGFAAYISRAAVKEEEDWMWVLVMRTFRLLRLVRMFRMIRAFRSVWRLVHGLINSYKTLFSTAALLTLTLYVFAILAVEFIAKSGDLNDDPVTEEIIQQHFGSLQNTMLTFTRFMHMDSAWVIYEPLIQRKPILVGYFGCMVLVISVGLMNVVTAVLVEGALDHANQDKELLDEDLAKKLAHAIPKLERIFEDMDVNHDGTVTLEEIEKVPIDVIPQELFHNHRAISTMPDLFLMLDVDEGGTLSHDEFFQGLVSIALHDASIETLQCYRMAKHSMKIVKDTEQRVRQIDEGVQAIQNSLKARGNGLLTLL